MTPKQRVYLRWALRLVGPVVLAIVLLRLPDPGKVLELARGADLLLLGAAAALNFVGIQLKVIRWQAMLSARSIVYPTKLAWTAFASSMYLGMLTPGRVGDVLRVQYLRHDTGASYAEGLASVVMDRLCDLYVLAGFVAYAIVHFSAVISSDLRLVSWLVVIGTVVAPLVLLVPVVARRVVGGVYNRVSADSTGLETFIEAMQKQTGWVLAKTLPLTVVSFLLGFVQAWLIARAMGLDLSYVDVMCLTAIASLVGLLPISVSGVGVRESLFAAVFPSLGHTSEQGVSYGLLVFFILYIGTVVIGFLCWQIRPPPIHSTDPGSAVPPR